jgi:hypothetical protein
VTHKLKVCDAIDENKRTWQWYRRKARPLEHIGIELADDLLGFPLALLAGDTALQIRFVTIQVDLDLIRSPGLNTVIAWADPRRVS